MKLITLSALTGLALSTATAHTYGYTVTLDISGLGSWGFQGDPANDILEIFVGENAPLISISWDLYITTVGISWAQEVTIGIFDNQIIVNPAAGDDFSVTNQNYRGSIPVTNMYIGTDGILDIEFYETEWDDNSEAIDAYFEEGSVIIAHFMPTPSTLAIFGFSGLAIARRRR